MRQTIVNEASKDANRKKTKCRCTKTNHKKKKKKLYNAGGEGEEDSCVNKLPTVVSRQTCHVAKE